MSMTYLWWLFWLMIPISIYSIKVYKWCLLLCFSKYSSLIAKKKTKVAVKLLAAVYYFCIFTIEIANFSEILAMYQDTLNGTARKLSDFEDSVLRCAIVMVVSFYMTEIFYRYSEMRWVLIIHHIATTLICFCVFEGIDDIEPYVSRVFIVVFGFLLTSQWILYAASVYYYLSPQESVKSRLFLYTIGICTHVLFTIGQIYCGIKFKINNADPDENRKLVSLIIFIIFEVCIIPTQLASFYDFYMIFTKKILVTTVTEKMEISIGALGVPQLSAQSDVSVQSVQSQCPSIKPIEVNHTHLSV